MKAIPLSALPFVDLESVTKLKIGNERMQHTLKDWTEVEKMLNDTGSISRAMPIMGNIEFPPQYGTRNWTTKGFFTLNQPFGETF